LETLLKRTLSQSDDNRVTQIEVNGQIINLGQSGEIAAHLIANVLHGHDLDKDAVDVTEALLFLALSHISETYPLLSFAQNLDVRDTLIHEQDSPSYDIIIGNPPYVRLTRKDSEYRELIKARYSTRREYNVHALFVEESLRQLRPGGVLSYLVHKNLLTLDTYYDLRRTLLESYNLIHLSDCGPGQFRGVTAETAILVTGKGPKTPSMNLTLSRFDGSIGGCSPSAAFNIDEYNTLISPWNKRFVIGLTQDSVAFLREVENHPRLDSRVEIRRGIETGNNARFLSENPTGRGDWRPVLRGRDVSMYEVSLNMYLDYNRSALAKPGKSDLKVTPKVIIQQNSRSPIAYYDRGRFLVLNSITYLAGADEDVLKAICVILNSTFISWFFRTVMTNNAGLTVNLLPNNVGRIPYPHSPEVATLSSLCDILAEIKSNSERYQADFDTWHKIIAECAVLESYLPGLLGDCRVTRSLEKYRGSFHSLSKSQVASIVGTARKQLKKLNLPLVMASDHWML
ncbi:MAG: Eco57I restriction-modification methylase domain-containing protein, partial [Candidatus Thorarchaeota archaeon]